MSTLLIKLCIPQNLPDTYTRTANAVHAQDNLEFLEDVIPKTAPYKAIKAQAAAARAQLNGEKQAENGQLPNGKKQKSIVNGNGNLNGFAPKVLTEEDPNAQLELEMRQAAQANEGDVNMTG